MAPRKKSMQVVDPTPVDEETRPLLDEEHPDHGTISRQEAYLEGAEDDTLVVNEPSTLKLLATMIPLYISAFFAAAGMCSTSRTISTDHSRMTQTAPS